jgi:hypothetical protein
MKLIVAIRNLRTRLQIYAEIKTPKSNIRGSADKSLARPTSRSRRTESIVSLERGGCSCAEFQVFSCYRVWNKPCQATCAFSATSRRELSSTFFCKPRRQRIVTPFWEKHYANMHHRMSPSKLGGGDFSTCDAPRPGRPKTVTTSKTTDQI